MIVQDATTLEVLMLAYMNQEAFETTIKTGVATYYSRSRQSLWVKGETSGNRQDVRSFSYDCDQDALLLKVTQHGVACHTGHKTCFYEDIISDPSAFSLDQLYTIIQSRQLEPKEGSYTNYLLDKGLDKILKKVSEEAGEVIIAAKNNIEELVYETADLFYHVMVLLVNQSVTTSQIFDALRSRQQK